MSEADGFLILDTQKSVTGEKYENPKIPCPRSVVGKKLADISNLPRKSRPIIQDTKMQPKQISAKEYTDQLQKEKVALEKMVAQKNKIIEKSGIELERLRVNLFKMQEQNQQLALSNTQMIAELNTGKDRLKGLHHELGCKTGLVKAMKLELEENARKKQCQNVDTEEEGVLSKEGEDCEKPCNTKRRLPSNSLRSYEQVQSKEKTETKRPFMRRQSARFKPIEVNPEESLNERDGSILSKPIEVYPAEKRTLPEDPVMGEGSICVNVTIKNEDIDCSSDLSCASKELGRSSLCRPSREAAKRVQSYKEVPLNIKMRRPE